MTFLASIRSRSRESKKSTAGPEPAGLWDRSPDPGGHALGLNPQQAAAVLLDHESDGPALVLAGAGSGKTTVLARRIARQTLLDGRGEGILALTFTKEAAGEMESRVRGLLENTAALPADAGPASVTPGVARSGRDIGIPIFGTFHAFAFGLVRAEVDGRPNWKRLGFTRCPSLLDPSAQSAWLAEVKQGLGIEATADELERMVARPFEDPTPPGPRDDTGDGTRARLAEELRRRYRDYLLESGLLAFDDMVALAIRLLREHPEALAEVRVRIRRVLVDEFQDTSPDQLELIRIILGGRPSLFLVGDDDQAIYGFRGADPGNIARAMEIFPGMRILKLETNYRSTPPIVAYANQVFQGKPADLRKILRAGRPLPEGARPAPVKVLVHGSGVEQGNWMVAEMGRLIRENGLTWGDMALLFRINSLEPYYRSVIRTLAGPEAAGKITFATVHASKGLQYPAVFLVGLEDGVLPYRRKGEAADQDGLAEERRIFYVGVTRAERFLYLCACRRRMLRGRIRELGVSPFLGLGFRPLAVAVPALQGLARAGRGLLSMLGSNERVSK